ncbi:MAG: glycoside hydrolase family 31 protein [Bacteroidales bacterium]
MTTTISKAQHERYTPLGHFKEFSFSRDKLEIEGENGFLSLIHYSPDIVRIKAARNRFTGEVSYAVTREPEGHFQFKFNGKLFLLNTDSMKIIVDKYPLNIRVYDANDELISQTYPDLSFSWLGTEGTAHMEMAPGEKFIGLGEKTGHLNRRGSSYVHWNTDNPGYGTDADPLYKTIPFFISVSDGKIYGIFLDNTGKTSFNFGASTDNAFYSFTADDGILDYYFIRGNSISEIIEKYTYLTGRPQLPPLWSLGYQQCRFSYYPEKEVLRVADTFRDKKIPADVIYLDIHYMDDYKVFTWDAERFPYPSGLTSQLKDLGFRTVTIIDPGVKIETGYPLYEEGHRNNYFLKYPNGVYYVGEVWPGRCHFPDFTNPEVRTWWGSQYALLVDQGVSGFWNDMNEPAAWGQSIPNIIEFNYEGEGASLKKARNVYGLLMSGSAYEGSKNALKGERPFLLTRAAYSGIQRYSAVWTGDNVASDEHMLLGVRLVNSLGLSGVPFAGYDVGGFAGEASKELYARWISIGAFCPLFRSHTAYGNKSQEPWSFGEETEGIARKYIELRYRLLPYIYSAFFQSTQSGIPLQRSLALEYPFDDTVYRHEFENQYLFGDQIMVAPARSDEKFINVYFPKGEWYRLSSDEYLEGNMEKAVAAPLDNLPVFVKAGAIIPMQSIVQHTAQKPSDTLDIHIFKGTEPNKYVYYEDDGKSYRYLKGNYHLREIRYEPSESLIKLEKPSGNRTSHFRYFRFILHGFDGIRKMELNAVKQKFNRSDKVYTMVMDNISEQAYLRWE